MISLGELPTPDHASMVALEWEYREVWPYVNRYIKPALEAKGVTFSVIPRRDYATKDLWGGTDRQSILLPVYTNQSGEAGKLPEYCSGEWKREVVKRWAAEQEGWKVRGVDNWVGISWEERGRRRGQRQQWLRPVYPLLDIRPTHISGCLDAVKRIGWPEPPRSRCRHCPNQSDAEWAELSKSEFEAACQMEDEIRTVDPHAFFHERLIPLRDVTLQPDAKSVKRGGCSAGMCF